MEEEVGRAIEAALIRVKTGAVESAGVNRKRPGVFVEVLKERKRFKEVGSE